MKKAFTAFLILLFFDILSFAQNANMNLFRIERNKNANVVMYDVRVLPDGSIDKENPMDAYWIMNAEQGQRDEISAFEKKVYGYKIDYNDAGYYDLALKAVSDRPIKIVSVSGKYKAEIIINKKNAYLSTVYVFANDSFIPRVEYIILTGTDKKTSAKVTEKIITK
ncbi:MAG: DUF4833 domain-containing protein [Endomicrobium sp.]|jgi:hypothetical protein|nr:DUF4833 domain-containing protein [Endomicrobium sp.]